MDIKVKKILNIIDLWRGVDDETMEYHLLNVFKDEAQKKTHSEFGTLEPRIQNPYSFGAKEDRPNDD